MHKALTGREVAIVDAISDGKTAKEIARDLGISSRTVEAHTARARIKLGARDRAQLVAKAIRGGVIVLCVSLAASDADIDMRKGRSRLARVKISTQIHS